MLVIKKAQIQAFIAEDDTGLIRVIREIIREAFHEGVADYSDEKLDGMVRIGIEKAKSREFERAEDIAAFVAIMFEISPNFDIQEHIDAFFKDETVPKDMRMEFLLGRVQNETWAEAENTYDAKAWFPDSKEEA
ncbi:MAG: hypothetical protein IPM63_09725 [Acidobacteriota bacterium]|nr:MAG: hypothetical protein IPM63_09725 [Acidobacteriota bacterium]